MPVLRIAAGRRRRGRDARMPSRARFKCESDIPSEAAQHALRSTRRTARSRSRGAEKGDVLAVRILSIKPRGPQPVGTTALIPEFGGLVGTRPDGAPQRAPARAGQEDGGHAGRASASTSGSPCPTSRSSARSASVAGDRGGVARCSPTTGAATWTCRTWRRAPSLYFPVHRIGRLPLSRRLPRHPGRRRALRRRGRDPLDRRRSRST